MSPSGLGLRFRPLVARGVGATGEAHHGRPLGCGPVAREQLRKLVRREPVVGAVVPRGVLFWLPVTSHTATIDSRLRNLKHRVAARP